MKQEVLNDGSNQIQPDKQRRPAVEAANCSKAFIRRRSEGNNGIIVVDGGCLPRRYLHRPANVFWHRWGSAWQPRRCHVAAMCPCHHEVYVGVWSGSVSLSVMQERVRAFGSPVCLCVMQELAKYTVSSGKRARQKPSSPFLQSLHRRLSIPALLRQTLPH